MKKFSFILTAVSISLLSFVSFPPATWTLDKAHSNLRFSITSLMISEVEGAFKMTEATITAPGEEDFSGAAVSMIADVNSVDTNEPDRDKHLKSSDFFDAAKYPSIVFKSSSFEKLSDKKYKVTGDLTFHGITRQVVLDAFVNYGTHPMTKKTLAGFKITGTIKRTDFGISSSTPVAMLGDEVSIVANAQFAKN